MNSICFWVLYWESVRGGRGGGKPNGARTLFLFIRFFVMLVSIYTYAWGDNYVCSYQSLTLPRMLFAALSTRKVWLNANFAEFCRTYRKHKLLVGEICGRFTSVLTPSPWTPNLRQIVAIIHFMRSLPAQIVAQTVRIPTALIQNRYLRKAIKINIMYNKNVLTCY